MGFETDLDVIFALAHLPIHRLCQFVNQTAEGMFHDQDPPIRLPVTDCKEWVTFFVPHVSLGAAVIALFAVYTCHYLLYVVRPPRVVCSDLAKVKWLEAHCPVFFERYWPTAWAPQAHMQTILRAVVQMRHALKLHRRRLGERISHTCNRLNYYVPKLPPPTPSHHVGVRFLKRISLFMYTVTAIEHDPAFNTPPLCTITAAVHVWRAIHQYCAMRVVVTCS